MFPQDSNCRLDSRIRPDEGLSQPPDENFTPPEGLSQFPGRDGQPDRDDQVQGCPNRMMGFADGAPGQGGQSANSEAKLPDWLDVDVFATYLALNNLLVNTDSMIGMNNN